MNSWLEQTCFPLKLVDYEMTDNFIAIRAKDTAFSGTAKQMETFLELFTDKLKALEVDPGLCVICGLPADELALYVGLYCHFHPDCIDKEGYDFTSIATEDDPESEKEDKESDELVMLTPMGDIPANEDDESGDRPDKERISALAQEFSGDREQFLDDLRRHAVPSVDEHPRWRLSV